MDKLREFLKEFGTESNLNESKEKIEYNLRENYLVTFENKSYYIPKENYFYGDEEESIINTLKENSK
tara:strand:- start:388 stop:588 length:201 start_codon:yes stop_codon:yes gene_type:complete